MDIQPGTFVFNAGQFSYRACDCRWIPCLLLPKPSSRSKWSEVCLKNCLRWNIFMKQLWALWAAMSNLSSVEAAQ